MRSVLILSSQYISKLDPNISATIRRFCVPLNRSGVEFTRRDSIPNFSIHESQPETPVRNACIDKQIDLRITRIGTETINSILYCIR